MTLYSSFNPTSTTSDELYPVEVTTVRGFLSNTSADVREELDIPLEGKTLFWWDIEAKGCFFRVVMKAEFPVPQGDWVRANVQLGSTWTKIAEQMGDPIISCTVTHIFEDESVLLTLIRKAPPKPLPKKVLPKLVLKYQILTPKDLMMGDLMTREEWLEGVEGGMLTSDDGFGNAIRDREIDPETNIWPSKAEALPDDVTHILWFNK